MRPDTLQKCKCGGTWALFDVCVDRWRQCRRCDRIVDEPLGADDGDEEQTLPRDEGSSDKGDPYGDDGATGGDDEGD